MIPQWLEDLQKEHGQVTGMSIDRANRSQVYYFEDGYSANLDANGDPAQDNREYREEPVTDEPANDVANEADNLIALKIEALRFASIVPGTTADSFISAAEAIKTWLLAPADPEPEAEPVTDGIMGTRTSEALSEATGADLSALWAETGLEATPPREAPSSLA